MGTLLLPIHGEVARSAGGARRRGYLDQFGHPDSLLLYRPCDAPAAWVAGHPAGAGRPHSLRNGQCSRANLHARDAGGIAGAAGPAAPGRGDHLREQPLGMDRHPGERWRSWPDARDAEADGAGRRTERSQPGPDRKRPKRKPRRRRRAAGERAHGRQRPGVVAARGRGDARPGGGDADLRRAALRRITHHEQRRADRPRSASAAQLEPRAQRADWWGVSGCRHPRLQRRDVESSECEQLLVCEPSA